MSQYQLSPREVELLKEALNTDYKACTVRLREGEYQYDLANTIASFELELYFPNVKDITKKMYGEERANDIQFIRKIQTILKKMQKGGVVKILPKKKPWALQRYALSSFKFQDTDKNLVLLVTDQQIDQAKSLLDSTLIRQETPVARMRLVRTKICILAFAIVASYIVILRDFTEPKINPMISIPAFSIAAACSVMLGKLLSRK